MDAMDPFTMAVDEVALEGLDGITFPCLWIRLEDRKPKFPLKLDDCTKELLWKSFISNSDLKFYQLPQEREDVVLFDRFKDPDSKTDLKATQKPQKDIYPVHMIIDNEEGIQGSCAFFKQRTEVTEHVRSKSFTPLVSLEESFERYGRKLVVVASQVVRFRTLIGEKSDPDLKLSDDSYCVLERVGRGRWQGEIQKDLHGCAFKIDARKLHYMRKSLVRHGLVSMQAYCTRLKTGQQQHSILLLLKRFHVNRRSKYDVLMEYVSNLLQQVPGQLITLVTLKELLNVNEGTFKRLLKYMRAAKLSEFCLYPLEDLDPSAGPCTNKGGGKVRVRCLKLVKPYTGNDDDDEDEEEDEIGDRSQVLPSEGRIMELDVLSQAYHTVVSCGTKGIPQRDIGFTMKIGKLESRMLCRRLERDAVIKGFMVDEGRQRTTNFISHTCVGVSDHLQLFAKEQERTKLLHSAAPKESDTGSATPKTQSTPEQSEKLRTEKELKNEHLEGTVSAEEPAQVFAEVDTAVKDLDMKGGRTKGRNTVARKSKEGTKTQLTLTIAQPKTTATSSKSKITRPDSVSSHIKEQPGGEPEQEYALSHGSALSQGETSNTADNAPENNIVVVKNDQQVPKVKKSKNAGQRSHETYRLLRRKNLIIEAVHKFKIIDGLFPLQKIISDEEKQDGIRSKCCKKTILRLIHSLCREGLLKIYRTTVVQDGITKKVEMVVHPSIQPNDDIVNRVIEQIRFKISGSAAAQRLQQAEEKQGKGTDRASRSFQAQIMDNKGTSDKEEEQFKPATVRGLGKTLGFQPKMHRLRIVHNFLWYLIYAHPCKYSLPHSHLTSQASENQINADTHANRPDNDEQQLPGSSKSVAVDSVESPQGADSALFNLDVTTYGNEEETNMDNQATRHSKSDMKVYNDEESWKRFVPPICVHKELGSGWAMVSDLLLCLPLSIFIQVIQINYKVDGLEEYLSDPVKQHVLVRALPAAMKRQLLYKRKYIFTFHENLQKLVYMGLVQFGPVEKFKEKDQVLLYLRRNATIVDTTSSEPHYWLVTEPPDKPFERRQYMFNSAEDVENYWLDLMCVCLNTPLGVIRSKRNVTEEESSPPSFVHERNVFAGMAYLLKGSSEVCDNGSVPGDGRGAGGLDSEFFAHLKRNWLWTNHLLTSKTIPSGLETKESKVRLKSLLSINALRIALKAGGSTSPCFVTTKRPLVAGNVEIDVEPASRNQQVVGGKRQKRKRSKKEVVKAPRKKKKELKKRTPAHDAADHQALKMMTRQRVSWSAQEDSLMMLCSVASYLLNSKLKRPFIPHCVVRDLLHKEFEISIDKTSVAVGRRTRHILRNPQTLLNYRICLAEVFQDKPLMKLLEEKKPANPDNPEDCGKAFSEYVGHLRQKFSSALSHPDTTLPDTKHQLFSQYKVSAIDSGKRMLCRDVLKCTDEIHATVLHNLIQSTLAMTNAQMKSSRSFQTFQLYSKYNQELLCQVFIQCRKKGLVNRRRVNQPFGPKKNRALPILPMSYQLSQSYYRCFSWRFPHSLCTDSFRFLRTLIDSNIDDERPVIVFYHEPETRPDFREVVTEKRGSERKIMRSENGKPVTKPVAQPKRANDDPMVGENEQHKGEQKNPEDCPTAGPFEDPCRLPTVTSSNKATKAPEEAPNVSDMLQFSPDSPGGVCVVSLTLMSLGLLSVFVSIPKQIVVVDSNLVDNDVVKSMAALEEEDDDDDDVEDCEGRKRLEVKAHQASHTNYLIMRGYCSPGIVKIRNLNTSDNVVVESCIMRLQLRNTPSHDIFSMENPEPLDLTKCGPSLLPSRLTYTTRSSSSTVASVGKFSRHLIEQRGYTHQDTEACAQLWRSLEVAGENGLDIYELCEAHIDLEEPQGGCTRSLQQYMKELQEEGLVLQVGSMGVRWVLMQYAEPWLLTVKSKPWFQGCFTSDPASQHSNSTYKRCRHEVPLEKEEPLAKKIAVYKHADKDGETTLMDIRERVNSDDKRKQQKDRAENGDEDKLLVLEEKGSPKMQSEEGGEAKEMPEMMETGDKDKYLLSRRSSVGDQGDAETCSLLTGPDDDEDDSVSFISRPWRMVDGSLNRQACKGMLEALLFHIMSRPGLTQKSLAEHYKDVLQPVAVLELVQALIDLGCVTKKTLSKIPKPSLFCSVPQWTKTKVKTEEPDAVFYEPTITCCLRLSQVLPNERHWSYCTP